MKNVMKVMVLGLLAMSLSACTEYKDAEVKDMGKVQIGDNVYLKQIKMSYDKTDRVYIMVDKDDKIIRSPVTVNYTDGKVQKTNAFVVQ